MKFRFKIQVPGEVMPKPLRIQKCDGGTDIPTDTARCRDRVSATKKRYLDREGNGEHWQRKIALR